MLPLAITLSPPLLPCHAMFYHDAAASLFILPLLLMP